MPKPLTVILTLIGVAIFFVFMPTMMSGLFDFRTDEQSDAFTVPTGGAETTAQVTLAQDLWENGTQFVESIASDLGTDNPVASNYASTTHNLTVSGLTAGTSRNLTVVYNIAALDEFQGVATLSGIMPLLLMASVVLIPIAVVWVIFIRR